MAVIGRGLLALASAVAADKLNFLVMGDWGGKDTSPYTRSSEVKTAKSMDKAASDLGAKFTLALGDNFYYSGIPKNSDADDQRFLTTFEQCFSGQSLSAKSGHNFHLVAGNHDHLGNVQAQIDYSQKSARWNFPELYYTFTEISPDGAEVQFVMIDTVSLSGQSQLNDHDVGGLKGSELPGPADVTAANAQMQWIEKTLASSTADYLIVAGHYPVFSVAEHGPTNKLSPKNFPQLRKYRVSTYLCGHDHVEQHIDVGDGVQYHVIGSANFQGSWDHISSVSASQLKYHAITDGGFATVSADKAGMVIKHYDGDGGLRYTAPAIPPRGSLPPTPAPTPTPSPSGDWECETNQLANIGKDTNLQHTGDDRSSCTSACEGTANCLAVYWHKTDNHCHVLTGSFSHDDWQAQISSNSDYDSCYKTGGPKGALI